MLSFSESSWLLSQTHTHAQDKRDIRDQRTDSDRDSNNETEIWGWEREMETRERDLERLIPMHKSGEVVLSVPPSPLASPIHVAGREVLLSYLYLVTNFMQVCNDWFCVWPRVLVTCMLRYLMFYVQTKQAVYKVIRSWASKKFMTGWYLIFSLVCRRNNIIGFMSFVLLYSVILLPIAVTFYFTWWFIHFVDGFFSPIYTHLGINMFG